MTLQAEIYPVLGGLDLVTPARQVSPGRALRSLNYEPAEGGAMRMDGYERFDGQAKPSDAFYWYLTFTNASALINANDSVFGLTSGAIGTAVAAATITSGTTGAGTAAGYVLLVAPGPAAWIPGETIRRISTNIATCVTGVMNGSPVTADHQAALTASAAARRLAIQKPTGDGAVLGVWTYNGWAYAVRVNGSAATLSGSDLAAGTGWQTFATTETVSFTTGTAAFQEGETLTRGGVTSTIRRVVVTSGTWGGGNAAGYVVVTGRTGGNYTSGVGTSASGSATLVGPQATVTLPNAGNYRFVNHAFGGAARSLRMYFVTGNSYAFEFDGTYLVPIRTGQLSEARDKPTHIAVFGESLFLAYRFGSLLFSALGNPLSFLVSGGAGEIGFGDRITAIIPDAQTAVVIGGREKISYLTGTSSADFVMKVVTSGAGMKVNSEAQMLRPMYVDDRGIRDLTATQEFGDWKAGSVSDLIAPLFEAKRRAGVEPVEALAVRKKNQYRLFLSDRSGLMVRVGGKVPEILPFALPFDVTTSCSGEDLVGNEIVLIGTADGWVYEMDRGTSFDGATIPAQHVLHFNDCRSPQIDKRFHSVEVDLDTPSAALLGFSAEVDDASGERPAKSRQDVTVAGGDAFRGQLGWDWTTPINGKLYARIDGAGQNVSLAFASESATEAAHTIGSIKINWSKRRWRRFGV